MLPADFFNLEPFGLVGAASLLMSGFDHCDHAVCMVTLDGMLVPGITTACGNTQ
jgi:hypothetical protein